MGFFDYIKTALENIGSAKLRSLLTSLGIIIGIGSVVLISSIGGGVSSTITSAFSGLGSTQMSISSSAPVRPHGHNVVRTWVVLAGRFVNVGMAPWIGRDGAFHVGALPIL